MLDYSYMPPMYGYNQGIMSPWGTMMASNNPYTTNSYAQQMDPMTRQMLIQMLMRGWR